MRWIGVLMAFLAAIFLVRSWAEHRRLDTRRRHLRGAPAFDPTLVDCYVRFLGRVEMPNTEVSPLRRRPCVFFLSRVYAEWQTKLKKPKKGLATHRKTLYRQESPPKPIKLANARGVAYLAPGLLAGSEGTRRLNREKSESPDCPAICAGQAQDKYKTYAAADQWLANGDTVAVYAKLERHEQGRLTLAATGNPSYPSVLLVESEHSGTHLRGLLAEVDRQIAKVRLGGLLRAIALLIGLWVAAGG